MPRKAATPTRIEGQGFIFQPTYRDKKTKELKHSAIWWMEYQTRDEPVRRSTGRKDQQEAFNELVKAVGRRVSGAITTSAPERVTIGELLDLLVQSYSSKRTLYDLELRVERHLRPMFGNMKAIDLTSRDLRRFVELCRKGRNPVAIKDNERGKPAPPKRLTSASINRCLANLRRAFVLGTREDPPLVLRIPYFPWQEEDNVRHGMMDRTTYESMRGELAPHAALALVIGYHTGMRRGEILGLRWDQVDLKNGVIRLDRKQVKNKKERTAPIYGDMRPYMEMALANRSAKYPKCNHVVAEHGKRVFSLRSSWSNAIKRLNIPKVLLHDLRRTAASNMEDAGIGRSAIMEIVGWKSEAMFLRYQIGSKKRTVKAGKTMEDWMETERLSKEGHRLEGQVQ